MLSPYSILFLNLLLVYCCMQSFYVSSWKRNLIFLPKYSKEYFRMNNRFTFEFQWFKTLYESIIHLTRDILSSFIRISFSNIQVYFSGFLIIIHIYISLITFEMNSLQVDQIQIQHVVLSRFKIINKNNNSYKTLS